VPVRYVILIRKLLNFFGKRNVIDGKELFLSYAPYVNMNLFTLVLVQKRSFMILLPPGISKELEPVFINSTWLIKNNFII
jgi:hypothetical protein